MGHITRSMHQIERVELYSLEKRSAIGRVMTDLKGMILVYQLVEGYVRKIDVLKKNVTERRMSRCIVTLLEQIDRLSEHCNRVNIVVINCI